jgi:DNA polymerase-3 subunit gamma/tau
MSYTVLARRYRSASFDDVIGQEHVAQTLKRAIETGRIAHAYLFCGTRGTGKTSMARILAKALNCEKSKGPTTEPCNKCESCLAIARGDDIDVIEIDAASNTGVDNVRDLINNAQFMPARSRFKVYIIDEAHMLSKAAFNALLKTLEEPPGHVKFILATTEPEKLLPTILSRVQRYDFRNIPTREIVSHLKNIVKQEKLKADEDALLLVAKAGAGSMRDSLSLLDRLLSVGEKQLTAEMIEQMLGTPPAQVIFDLVNSIGEADAKTVLERSHQLISQGLSPDTLVASLTDHLRNLLVLRTCGPDSELVEVAGVAMEDLATQAQKFEPMILSQDIAILEELRRNLKSSTAGRALLDATLVRLALAEQFASVEELLAGGDGAARAAPAASRPSAPALKKNAEALGFSPSPLAGGGRGEGKAVDDSTRGSAPTESAARTPPPSPLPQGEGGQDQDDDDLPRPGKVWDNSGPSLSELLKQSQASSPKPNVEPVDAANLDQVFKRLREAVVKHGPGIDAFLSGGRLVALADGNALIRYPHELAGSARMLDRNGKKDILQQELSGLLGQTIGVRFEVDDQAAAAEPAAPTRPRVTAPPRPAPVVAAAPSSSSEIRLTPELRESLAQDPLVKAVMTELGGEIVKVEE